MYCTLVFYHLEGLYTNFFKYLCSGLMETIVKTQYFCLFVFKFMSLCACRRASSGNTIYLISENAGNPLEYVFEMVTPQLAGNEGELLIRVSILWVVFTVAEW